MHRRKFLSAIFIMPFVAKAIAENWTAGEEGGPISLREGKAGLYWDKYGNPTYMKDEYMIPHDDKLQYEGAQDNTFIEYEIHPFGKVRFKTEQVPDWLPERVEFNGKILNRIYTWPKEVEVPKPLVTWQLFDKNQTRAMLCSVENS